MSYIIAYDVPDDSPKIFIYNYMCIPRLVCVLVVRTQLGDADACIILAHKGAADPDVEDSRNIMRAAATKNFNHDIHIVIQLLQHHNKVGDLYHG